MINERALIIAEIGVNHQGDMSLAKNMIDAAVKSGVDIVKFQTFTADDLVTKKASKADYQNIGDDAEYQYDMLKRLELSYDDHVMLKDYCDEKNIGFLSTPFSVNAVKLLSGLGLSHLKISSGEIVNAPLLVEAARTGLPIIMSSGMGTLEDLHKALSFLAYGYLNAEGSPSGDLSEKAFQSDAGKKVLKDKVTLLHCTTSYPAPLEDVNLLAMDTISDTFGLPVGYSDHTEGIETPLLAIARGATVIEKHFTTDKTLKGPDQQASSEPPVFKALMKYVNSPQSSPNWPDEKMQSLILGSREKKATKTENDISKIARQVVIVSQNIKQGETFSPENLTSKRSGISNLEDVVLPTRFFDLIGKKAQRDYEVNDMVSPEELSEKQHRTPAQKLTHG